MYRHDRENIRSSSLPASSVSDGIQSVAGDNEATDVTAAVRDTVNDCWTAINQQCSRHEQQTADVCKGWQTIRLFVSSTFADMYSEREFLIKKV